MDPDLNGGLESACEVAGFDDCDKARKLAMELRNKLKEALAQAKVLEKERNEALWDTEPVGAEPATIRLSS